MCLFFHTFLLDTIPSDRLVLHIGSQQQNSYCSVIPYFVQDTVLCVELSPMFTIILK